MMGLLRWLFCGEKQIVVEGASGITVDGIHFALDGEPPAQVSHIKWGPPQK